MRDWLHRPREIAERWFNAPYGTPKTDQRAANLEADVQTWAWVEEIKVRTHSQGNRGRTRTDQRRVQLMIRLYLEHEMAAAEIGEVMGCHATTVKWHLNYNGVPLRSKSEQMKAAYRRGRKKPPAQILRELAAT